MARSSAPLVIGVTVGALGIIGAGVGVALALTMEPDADDGGGGHKLPPDDRDKYKGLPPPDDDDGEKSKGLAPPDERKEATPEPSDVYGDLPPLGKTDRPGEVYSAVVAVIAARPQTLTGAESTSDLVDKWTDLAFIHASKLGKAGKLSPDNPTHKPYIAMWVRLRADVARMVQLAGLIPRMYPDNRARQIAFAMWALAMTATGPLRSPKQLREGWTKAFAYYVANPAKMSELAKAGAGFGAIMAELAVRLHTGGTLPPGKPWANWSAASKAANRVLKRFP